MAADSPEEPLVPWWVPAVAAAVSVVLVALRVARVIGWAWPWLVSPLWGLYVAGLAVVAYAVAADLFSPQPNGRTPMTDTPEALTPLPPKWTGKFRRKPDVTVEAVQWDGAVTTATDLINWILASGGTARYHDDPSALSINRPVGTVTAVPGDWIIRHGNGEFWACPDSEFRAAYEPAAPDGCGISLRNQLEALAVKLEGSAAEYATLADTASDGRNSLRAGSYAYQECAEKIRALLAVDGA